MVVLIILAFIGIAVYEIPRLVKGQRKKELVWFCILLTTGFILNILLFKGVNIPGPIKIVIDFLNGIGLHY